MNNTNMPIIEEFIKVAETGNELAARKFLVDHVKEFPEDVQKKIISAFFFEALEKKADEITKKAKLQKTLLGIFDDIKKAELNLTEEKQKIEVREKLAQ